jgi:hypothetical protein
MLEIDALRAEAAAAAEAARARDEALAALQELSNLTPNARKGRTDSSSSSGLRNSSRPSTSLSVLTGSSPAEAAEEAAGVDLGWREPEVSSPSPAPSPSISAQQLKRTEAAMVEAAAAAQARELELTTAKEAATALAGHRKEELDLLHKEVTLYRDRVGESEAQLELAKRETERAKKIGEAAMAEAAAAKNLVGAWQREVRAACLPPNRMKGSSLPELSVPLLVGRANCSAKRWSAVSERWRRPRS